MRIYKILRATEWSELDRSGQFEGSEDDRADGFIHMCTQDQIGGVIADHFLGESGLILAGIEADDLGDDLKWEESRGGDTFPHLYRPLKRDDVVWNAEIPRGGADDLKLGG